MERRYPALKWAPADASWVVVAARVTDAVTALSELGELVAMARGTTVTALVGDVRDTLGVSPLSADELAKVGIKLDGSMALFGQNGYPTLVLPVADGSRLASFLDRQRPDRNAAVTQHRGHDVFSWTGQGWTVAWAVLDGWLVVRVQPESEPPATWLDEVLAAPGGGTIAADPALAAAARNGRAALDRTDGPGLVGLARLDRLARDVAAWPGGWTRLATCVEHAAIAAPVLEAAAEVSWDGATAWLGADLGERAAALRDHIAPPAPPGFYAYRDASPIALAWTLDVAWLDQVRAALDCEIFPQRIRDPVRAMTGYAGPRAIHLAATKIDPDDLSGSGAAHLVLTDPDLVTAQLEAIPARSLFERSRKIHGVSVKVLSVPSLPSILYRLDKDRFTIALGSKVMETVLAPAPAGQDPGPAAPEVLHLKLEPGRVRNLGTLLALALDAIGLPRRAGPELARRLSRYERGSLTIDLTGDVVSLRAAMRLRK